MIKKYLVIGNPVDHSLSPKLHNYWLKENNIDAIYDKKKLDENELKNIISKVKEEKISDEALFAYNVYQIEGEGRSLFSKIDGDEDTIMGLPVKKIKEYINSLS